MNRNSCIFMPMNIILCKLINIYIYWLNIQIVKNIPQIIKNIKNVMQHKPTEITLDFAVNTWWYPDDPTSIKLYILGLYCAYYDIKKSKLHVHIYIFTICFNYSTHYSIMENFYKAHLYIWSIQKEIYTTILNFSLSVFKHHSLILRSWFLNAIN